MSARIHGAEHPIQKIFSDEFAFTIPLYQRPYSWTTEQAEELLSDLLEALPTTQEQVQEGEPYFLGSIVLIKQDGKLTLPLFSVPVGLRISQHTGGHMKGKRYTEQQILDILGQLDAGTPISDLTRLHGVASATIYRWKAKYGGMTKEETRKFRQLEVENQRLKKLVADLSLDNVMLKEVVGRKW